MKQFSHVFGGRRIVQSDYKGISRGKYNRPPIDNIARFAGAGFHLPGGECTDKRMGLDEWIADPAASRLRHIEDARCTKHARRSLICRQFEPTAREISGSLVVLDSTRLLDMAISTTYGSTVLPPTYGLGWAEATTAMALPVLLPGYLAHWVHQPLETYRRVAMGLLVGPTQRGTYGSLEAATTLAVKIISTTSGSSTLRPTNGHG